MRIALTERGGIETLCGLAHFASMTEQTPTRPAGFRKPAHWTNDPPPAPQATDPLKNEPRDLSPTRYGDWVEKGIAIDFS